MRDAPKRLVTRRKAVSILLIPFAWAGYRLYRDYEQDGGWDIRGLTTTGVTVVVALAIMVAVLWHANRPESERKP
jgi:hypothetical protein